MAITKEDLTIANGYHTERIEVALEGIYEYVQSNIENEDEDYQWLVISYIARKLINSGVDVYGSHGERNEAEDFEEVFDVQ